jgi:hypothetical protein
MVLRGVFDMFRPTHRSPLRSRWIAIAVIAATIAIPLSQVSAQNQATPESHRGAATSQSLIYSGLENGTIDYATSLVYRAYALFGDPRLPSAFSGDVPADEDLTFFGEVTRFWNELPKEAQNQLTPFIARPNDSRSVFYRPGGTAADPGSATPPDATPRYASGDCQDGWVSRDSTVHPFKIWMHCDGDYDADLDSAIEMVEVFWTKETDLMGSPIPDAGTERQGGDDRIDFYFVDSETDSAPRPGSDGIPKTAMAYATADEPVVGTGSSAFVVGRRPTIGQTQLALTLAHEFFHVLQYAHNWEIGFGFKGSPYSSDFDILTFAEMWFVEASADWMKSYIYRDILSPEEMQAYFHFRFEEYFQDSDLPLTFSPNQDSPKIMHIYAASVYFLFLEQELGPQAIATFWKEIETLKVDDFDGTTVVLDSILPFKEHFRDFTVRNFNIVLEPGDPTKPHYSDLDKTFPSDKAPVPSFAKGENGRLPVDGDPKVYQTTVPALAAHYYFFTPDSKAAQFTMDFSCLAPNDGVDIDLVVKVKNGNWERRQFPAGSPITFCRAIADQNVETVYAVVTNHNMFDDQAVRGSFSAQAISGACS